MRRCRWSHNLSVGGHGLPHSQRQPACRVVFTAGGQVTLPEAVGLSREDSFPGTLWPPALDVSLWFQYDPGGASPVDPTTFFGE